MTIERRRYNEEVNGQGCEDECVRARRGRIRKNSTCAVLSALEPQFDRTQVARCERSARTRNMNSHTRLYDFEFDERLKNKQKTNTNHIAHRMMRSSS